MGTALPGTCHFYVSIWPSVSATGIPELKSIPACVPKYQMLASRCACRENTQANRKRKRAVVFFIASFNAKENKKCQRPGKNYRENNRSLTCPINGTQPRFARPAMIAAFERSAVPLGFSGVFSFGFSGVCRRLMLSARYMLSALATESV